MDQVKPSPASETMVPKLSLASTLHHGAGVTLPALQMDRIVAVCRGEPAKRIVEGEVFGAQ